MKKIMLAAFATVLLSVGALAHASEEPVSGDLNALQNAAEAHHHKHHHHRHGRHHHHHRHHGHDRHGRR
jgi:hypothetical protein